MRIYRSSFRPKPLLLLQRKYRLASAAFSLVEVTLALGIVTFSVLTLVGLIPMGLTTFHKAVNTSVSSQIVQQVVTDVQQTDFNELVSSTSQVNQQALRYFDDQGNELTNTGGAIPSGTIYMVNVVVNTPVTLPGGSASPQANLACLNIEIVNNPGKVPLKYDNTTKSVVQDSTTPGIYVSRYSAYVANNSYNN